MSNKDFVMSIIQQLPDDASIEAIYDKLDYILAVREGLKDADEGRFVPLEEVDKKIEQWATGSD